MNPCLNVIKVLFYVTNEVEVITRVVELCIMEVIRKLMKIELRKLTTNSYLLT